MIFLHMARRCVMVPLDTQHIKVLFFFFFLSSCSLQNRYANMISQYYRVWYWQYIKLYRLHQDQINTGLYSEIILVAKNFNLHNLFTRKNPAFNFISFSIQWLLLFSGIFTIIAAETMHFDTLRLQVISHTGTVFLFHIPNF